MPSQLSFRSDEVSGLGKSYGDERRIHQPSGGQKERVALARAVIQEPEVLPLDEPLAALDLKLRKEMQVEVKNLQERLKITFVFVTHDQDEALIMSDRIAVMNQGRIEQLESPEALYERPRTRFVADFLAVTNILEVEVIGVSEGASLARHRNRGDEVTVKVPPETILRLENPKAPRP